MYIWSSYWRTIVGSPPPPPPPRDVSSTSSYVLSYDIPAARAPRPCARRAKGGRAGSVSERGDRASRATREARTLGFD